jgi:DNA polymerase III delta subunit
VTAPRIDGRCAFYRVFKELGCIQEFALPDKAYAAEQQARSRLQDALAEQRLTMSKEAMDDFLERVGTDTRRLMSEVEKLSIFLGARRQAGIDDARRVTSMGRSAMAWDLADAMGDRDLARCMELVRQLTLQKESALGLVTLLHSRIRDLIIYREAIDKGWLVKRRDAAGKTAVTWRTVPDKPDKVFTEVLAKDPRTAHPFRMAVLASQATRFSVRRLYALRRETLKAHEQLVNSRLPASTILELLLIRMLSGDSARSAS